MEDIERTQSRLTNLRGAQPLLNALRTISLGSWQTALRRRRQVHAYRTQIEGILLALMPHVEGSRAARAAEAQKRLLLIAVGSERGLCGRYNSDVVDHALKLARDLERDGVVVTLAGIGAQIERQGRRRRRSIQVIRLDAGNLPSAQAVLSLVPTWIAQYEQGEFDSMRLVHHHYLGIGQSGMTSIEVIPPKLSTADQQPPDEADWYAPILETDPVELFTQTLAQVVALSVLDVLLDASAVEHATRFQLMETASQNAERLIEELSISMQAHVRQAITREVQTLAVSAGLLEKS